MGTEWPKSILTPRAGLSGVVFFCLFSAKGKYRMHFIYLQLIIMKHFILVLWNVVLINICVNYTIYRQLRRQFLNLDTSN